MLRVWVEIRETLDRQFINATDFLKVSCRACTAHWVLRMWMEGGCQSLDANRLPRGAPACVLVGSRALS